MARRLGAEKIEHWTPGMEQYGKPRTDALVKSFEGCWVEFKSSDESGDNIASVLAGLWIPFEVELQDTDDYFIWTRRPGEKYRTGGEVGRYYDRRGGLRACFVPVEVRS